MRRVCDACATRAAIGGYFAEGYASSLVCANRGISYVMYVTGIRGVRLLHAAWPGAPHGEQGPCSRALGSAPSLGPRAHHDMI